MDTEKMAEEPVFLNDRGLWSVKPVDGGEFDWLQFKTETDAKKAATMTLQRALRFQDKLLQRHLRRPDLLHDVPPTPKAPAYGMAELRRRSTGILRGHFSDLQSALQAPHEPHAADTLSPSEIWDDAKRQWALAKIMAIYVWIKWRLAFSCFWHGLRMQGGSWKHGFLSMRSQLRAKSRRRGFLIATQSAVQAKEHEERAVLLARMAKKKWPRVAQKLKESMRFDL